MKLVTNLSPLLPPLTGIGHYTKNLLSELNKLPVIEDIKGASAIQWCDRQALEQMLKSSGLESDTNS